MSKAAARNHGHQTKNTPKQQIALDAIPPDGMFRTIEHIHALAGGEKAMGLETLRQNLAILADDGTIEKGTKREGSRTLNTYRRAP